MNTSIVRFRDLATTVLAVRLYLTSPPRVCGGATDTWCAEDPAHHIPQVLANWGPVPTISSRKGLANFAGQCFRKFEQIRGNGPRTPHRIGSSASRDDESSFASRSTWALSDALTRPSSGPTGATGFYGKLKTRVTGFVYRGATARTTPTCNEVTYDVLTTPRRALGGGGLIHAENHVGAMQVAFVVKWARFAETINHSGSNHHSDDRTTPPMWLPYATHWFKAIAQNRPDVISPRALLELLVSRATKKDEIEKMPIPTLWKMGMLQFKFLAPRTSRRHQLATPQQHSTHALHTEAQQHTTP